MKIENTTNIPNELVKEIIRFVRPSGISNFDVMVKNGTDIAGKAYTRGSSYHASADPFVVCRVPPVLDKERDPFFKKKNPNNYPRKLSTYQIGHLKGKRYWLANRTECLVYIMAHELRHLWQAKMKNKKGYYPKSRGRFSEIDTEGYSITKLRAWRKQQ